MKTLRYSYCPIEKKPCMRWIEEWLKDCLCNIKDEISFGFGIASLVCWAVAEIPQIITNFRSKSAAGVSLAFLSTWIIGDVLNLVGCILEPATDPNSKIRLVNEWDPLFQKLPTQFYTAVLYTTVTIILALQCIYYNHFIKWWKRSKKEANTVKDEIEPLAPKIQNPRKAATNVPVDVPQPRDFYFMSARSLAGSDTPPTRYMKARSGPPILEHHVDSSSEEEDEEYSVYLPPPSAGNITLPRTIPRPVTWDPQVRYGAFVAASANLPHLSRALRRSHGIEFSGRRLTQEISNENVYGQWLGWLMAAIYMGGRIPQIWLNIKRGNVEGLNPLMFVFALIANATYVGSILVRTTEWTKIKANMPWLLDAIVCVLLDLFIILQYIFYKYIKQKKSEQCGECYGDYYVEANKPTY